MLRVPGPSVLCLVGLLAGCDGQDAGGQRDGAVASNAAPAARHESPTPVADPAPPVPAPALPQPAVPLVRAAPPPASEVADAAGKTVIVHEAAPSAATTARLAELGVNQADTRRQITDGMQRYARQLHDRVAKETVAGEMSDALEDYKQQALEIYRLQQRAGAGPGVAEAGAGMPSNERP